MKASVRSVPLVGQALWAANRVKATATEGQRFAFPSYTTMKRTNANHASAALNKWIKEAAKLDHTMYELRHTMADRLRDVECPEDVRLAIGGWTVGGRRGGLRQGLHPSHVGTVARSGCAAEQKFEAGVPEGIAADIVGHGKKTITYGLYASGSAEKQKLEALSKVSYPGPLGEP